MAGVVGLGLVVTTALALGAPAAYAANVADGEYQVSVVGAYSFTDHWSAPAPGQSFVPTLDVDQSLRWEETVRVVVTDGMFHSETPGPLKLEGWLKETDHQSDTVPADKENCDYSAWPNPLHNGRISDASIPNVVVDAIGVIHPKLVVSASIPSQVSLQVDQHGTTTGAFRTAMDCVNPKNPGSSVLLSDEEDDGGVRAGFRQGEQEDYGEAANPTAKLIIGKVVGKPERFETGDQKAQYKLDTPGASGPTTEELTRSVTTTITVKRVGS